MLSGAALPIQIVMEQGMHDYCYLVTLERNYGITLSRYNDIVDTESNCCL